MVLPLLEVNRESHLQTSRLSSNIFEPPPEDSLIPNQLAGDILKVVLMVPLCESTNHITDPLILEQVPLCV